RPCFWWGCPVGQPRTRPTKQEPAPPALLSDRQRTSFCHSPAFTRPSPAFTRPSPSPRVLCLQLRRAVPRHLGGARLSGGASACKAEQSKLVLKFTSDFAVQIPRNPSACY